LGYKGYVIKEYFQNLYLHQSDVTYDYNVQGKVSYFNSKTYPWKVTLIDTGLNTMTGGRIKRIKDYIDDDSFMLTYGDGLSNVNINDLLSFHLKEKKILTLTTVNPDGRFGILEFENNLITSFVEKPKEGNGWINGGFMVASNKIFDFIQNDETIFEKQTMKSLLIKREITGFKHYGFWQPMDTLRDKNTLDALYESGKAPWIK
jgi:glucose-1-phosphate cytidylyltransferase